MFNPYKIKAGDHYAGFHFGITFKTSISFSCSFDENCLYKLDGVDSYDINKLYGFSTTYNHHNQSARFGWRCMDGETIQLLTYTYKDGVRQVSGEEILGTVKPGETFTGKIEDIETHYIYTCTTSTGTVVIKESKSPDKVLFKYLLGFYFGGNNVAPHGMSIKFEKI